MTAVQHRADIDGLRAVAVIAVIVNHAAPRALPGGFVGVDVFFVISGFLITSIILRDLETGTFSFAAFYERRVRRLLPNLILLVLFCSCIAWFLLLPADFRNYARSLFSTTIFTSNIFFWRDSWYFAAPSQTKPLLHTWSLAIEEQYYLLFPVTLWALKRWLPGRIRAACVIGFVASLALSIWAAGNSQAAGFYLLPPRAWELLLGSLLVVGVLPNAGSPRALELFSAAGLLAIVLAAFAFDSATPFPGVAALLPCAGAALVIYAGVPPAVTTVRRILSWGPLVLVGLMSYSLYLWHWPLLAFARYYFLSELSPAVTSLVVAASVLLAYLAWRFVERPVRSKATLATRSRVMVACAISSIAMLAFAETGVRTEGWPRRFAGVSIIDFDSTVAELGRDPSGACFLPASRTVTWSPAACTFAPVASEAGESRRLFLIGDSFGAQFASWARMNFPGTVVELTAAACPPLFGYEHDVRAKWCSVINTMREQTLRTQRFTDVFLAGWWGQSDNASTMPALERTAHEILESGVTHLIVLGVTPHFADSPIDVVNRQRVFGRTAGDTLESDGYPQYRATLDRIALLPGVRVINVDDWLCHKGRCSFMHNGKLLFTDGAAHMTSDGVRYVMGLADWFPVHG